MIATADEEDQDGCEFGTLGRLHEVIVRTDHGFKRHSSPRPGAAGGPARRLMADCRVRIVVYGRGRTLALL